MRSFTVGGGTWGGRGCGRWFLAGGGGGGGGLWLGWLRGGFRGFCFVLGLGVNLGRVLICFCSTCNSGLL